MLDYPGQNYDKVTRGLLAPEGYRNPEPQSGYHLVVIGAGPAGLIAAVGAAGLGARVALVERHLLGGDCLNVGCVPSKAILSYVETHKDKDFQAAFEFARRVRSEIAPHDSVERYTELGVDVFLGEARFTDRSTVEVAGTQLQGRRFVICTGARAAVPPIPGLEEAQPLTNETLFDLVEQPRSLGILGAGVIGCEMAQAFARLGTVVHLFEMADQVLPLEDPEAGAVARQALVDDGVAIITGQAVTGIQKADGDLSGNVVCTATGNVEVSRVLVALGRQPNTDKLELDKAGVHVDENGFIVTDDKLRSSNRYIFAAGDCTSRQQFTHNADAQARVVVQNALFAPTASCSNHVVPRCIYMEQEIASIGASERDLIQNKVAYETFRFDFRDLDRGRVQRDTTSFAKVFTARGSDKILGATIVAPDAGEQLAAVNVLMANGLGLAALGKTIFPYPTRSEYLKRIADAYNRTRMTPRVASLFRRWLSFTDPGSDK